MALLITGYIVRVSGGRFIGVGLLLAGMLAGCTASAGTTGTTGTHVRLRVTPTRALFDTPVSVEVTGLAAATRVTLTTSSKDSHGTVWSASARFTVARSGTLSTRQAPTSGSYTTADRMGLFADQAPGGDTSRQAEFIAPAHWTVTVSAVVGGHRRAATTITRLLLNQVGVVGEALRPATAPGVYGEYFAPRSTAVRHPAVVVIGGSEGGLSTALSASELAAHGYPALALAYFDEPGLPQTLTRIPIEYFAKAFDWLAEQPGVDRHRMVIWGDSRGSEAALLTGAHFPQLVAGVVATSPSDVVNIGLPPSEGITAWTYRGRDLPFASTFYGSLPRDAYIPVAAVRGPIFAAYGTDDALWPSGDYVGSLQRELTAAHVPNRPTILGFDGAGHYVGDLLPYFPATDITNAASGQTVGGSEVADEKGRAAGWTKLLHWLAVLPPGDGQAGRRA